MKMILIIILISMFLVGSLIFVFSPSAQTYVQNLFSSDLGAVSDYGKIEPVNNGFINWHYDITGNESKWIDDIDIVGDIATITARLEEDLTYNECSAYSIYDECTTYKNITYYIPNSINTYDSKGVQISTINKDLSVMSREIFIVNLSETTYLKLGEHSVIFTAQNCTSGDMVTTCYINYTYHYVNDEQITGHNIVIQDAGSILNGNWTTVDNHGESLYMNLSGNLTIMTGGNMTGGNFSIKAENVNITAGGKIITSGLGYLTSEGIGAGGSASGSEGGAGGGYGGRGGNSRGQEAGLGYGSEDEPSDFGSGGGKGKYGTYGGEGGGIIVINATQFIAVEGDLLANGTKGNTVSGREGGGGSGGTIYLMTPDLQGSGNILARGGEGGQPSVAGSGSGGRISLDLTSDNFAGTLSASSEDCDGGGNCFDNGASGTIYKKYEGSVYGDLIIDNANFIVGYEGDRGARLDGGFHNFDNITITNLGSLELHNASVDLNLTDLNLITDGSGRILTSGKGNITITNDFKVENYTLVINNGTNINNLQNLTIGWGGRLMHSPNGNSQRYWMELELTKLDIQVGGLLNATSKGYSGVSARGDGGAGNGTDGGDRGAGAGYGGRGGNSSGIEVGGVTYGNETTPDLIGSAGGIGKYGMAGGDGGGAVKITADEIIVNGEIQADGETGDIYGTSDSAGSGSGGSIWLITDSISGSGNITADGGDCLDKSEDGGGGGGGRIHINTTTYTFSGINTTTGGIGWDYAEFGDNGTVIITISGEAPPTDNEYPLFSDYWDDNSSLIGQGWGMFNVTVNMTNSTVGLEINNTNYTAFNNTDTSIFNITANLTSAGTFSYYWWSYGNGSSNNYNISAIRYYTVNASADTTPPYFTEISDNVSVIYDTSILPVDFNATDDDSSVSSYHVNDTDRFEITADTGIFENSTDLGVGLYQVNISVNDTSDNFGFLIYTVEVNQSGATNITLYLNDATQNVTNVVNGSYVNLNATSFNYGNIRLFHNGTEINNATYSGLNATNFTDVQSYNFTAYFEGNENYTANWSNYNLWIDVTSGADITPPFFTEVSNNVSAIYDTSLSIYDFNATDETANSTYHVNDTARFNISSDTGWLQNITALGAGLYEVNVSFNDTSNNYGFLIFTYEINQSGNVNITLFIDDATENKTITSNSTATLNATSFNYGSIRLFNNGTEINNGSYSVLNITNFSDVGSFNITGFFEGNENYTANWSNYNLYVDVTVQAPDTTSPYFTTIPNNLSSDYHISQISQTFIGADDVAVSSYHINYTEKFSINAGTGVLENITSLGVGLYQINVSVNDTSNNFGYLIYTIEVNQSAGIVYNWVNNSRSNQIFYNSSDTECAGNWLNATLQTETGEIQLRLNGSLINIGATSIFNQTDYPLGYYNSSAYFGGNENYTSDYESWMINCTIYIPVETIQSTISYILPSIPKHPFIKLGENLVFT